MNKLHKIARLVRNGSIVTVTVAIIQSWVKSLIKHVIGFEWQHFYILSLDCNSSSDASVKISSDPNIKIATEADWGNDTVAIKELGGDKVNHIKERCSNPNYCCVIYKGDEVCCYGFISFKEMELNKKFKYYLFDNEAFFYDDHCFIPYRRQGLYKKVLNERFRIVKQQGYQKVLTIVTPANRPSWNGHKSWKKEQSFYWYRFRGKEYCTLKNYKPINMV